MSQDSVIRPRQSRSRESFARVKLSVLTLLEERGSSDFTVAEVSEASGLAVGSICGRFGSKATLVRLVLDEELCRLEQETDDALSARAPEGQLRGDLAVVIAAYVDVLHSNVDILRASMSAGASDMLINSRGAEAGVRSSHLFVAAVRRALSQNGVSASHDSLEWVSEVAYAVIARQFGIGTLTPGAPAEELPLETLKDRLTETLTVYLTRAT